MLSSPTDTATVADLLERLGDIPAHRVRLHPSPGSATEQDVIDIEAREGRLFELVDGTLVEKGMGYWESILGVAISAALHAFVRPRKLGYVAMSDGMMRILPGQVRMPDVSFTSRERFPAGAFPREPIPTASPDLAVGILSESNTPKEMARKRQEYFQSGTKLVWMVDPALRQVAVYTDADTFKVYDTTQTIDGGDVLPGFALELGTLFSQLDE
ncbi:Uma2 family endonuclease [Humisphaera borealis]|uniref:Uma2 family endonuclease n=1 Tax=Humisphaera borealis TaxID=2807512 RepID=A0A7M2X3W0_9BACT|nr:Uma2 family endonuclease [Humisphaera borealis]